MRVELINLDKTTATNGATPQLTTEGHIAGYEDLDLRPAAEIVHAVVASQDGVVDAVLAAEPALARAVDALVERIGSGGRLVYVGAGTSGRIAEMDAAECRPTFGVEEGRAIALVAGSHLPESDAREAAEDDEGAARNGIGALAVSAADAVVGVSASGRTPYALAGLEAAAAAGALTIAVVCANGSPMAAASDLAIEVVVGPEVITGSTRLKAATAQKLILNALSTGTFVRLGRTYGNRMVHVRATHPKLQERAARLVADATGADVERAREAVVACGDAPTAIVSLRLGLSAEAACALLEASGGDLRRALGERP